MRRAGGVVGLALAVLITVVAVAPVAAPDPAGAAGVGQYGAPEWLPLRRGIDGSEIVQGCTYRSYGGPLYDCNGHHATWAIDFLVPKGTLVYAAGAGQVAQVHEGEPGCSPTANFVDIDHDPGYGGQWSNYWHLDQVFVDVGDWVDEDTVIGTVGDTGMSRAPDANGECGPHLHYIEPANLYQERRDPGRMWACHGGEFVSYPTALGYATWEGIPWGSFTLHSDGTYCNGPPGPFPDVRGNHAFAADVAWAAEAGVATGFADGFYRPAQPVTRQAMAGFLTRTAGQPDPGCGAPPFPDVATSNPFCGAIAWVTAQGIASGYGDGTYRPGATVSRQAMAGFLAGLGGAQVAPCTGPPFPDVPTSNPFCGAIAWAKAAGVVQGTSGGGFAPTADVTRGAMAAFLHRTAQL